MIERTTNNISGFLSSKIQLFLVIQICHEKRRGTYFIIFPKLIQEETLRIKFVSLQKCGMLREDLMRAITFLVKLQS